MISTLFNGSSHSEWLPPYVVQREAFLCREFHIKVTETKVPKKKKEKKKDKKKNNFIRLSAAYSFFFFFLIINRTRVTQETLKTAMEINQK